MHPITKKASPKKTLCAIAGISALALTGAIAPIASADVTFSVSWTHIGIYPRSEPSMGASKVGSPLADGDSVTIKCEQEGETVTSDAGTSVIWEQLADNTWIPNVFVETGVNGWSPNLPHCSEDADNATSELAAELRKRFEAAAWARENYKTPILLGASECTIFISHALWAGGIPPTSEWTPATTDKSKQGGVRLLNKLTGGAAPTVTATAADDFKNYVKSSGLGTVEEIEWSDNTAGGAQLGDIIAYDWEGRPDGKIDHLAIVTSRDANGYPSVTQRTTARLDRFWSWDPGGNDWIQNSYRDAATGDEPRVYLIRINY